MRSSEAVLRAGCTARRIAPFVALALALASPLTLNAQRRADPNGRLGEGGLIEDVEGFRFVIPDIESRAGAAANLEIQGQHEVGIQGFQVVARYPAEHLTIDEIHARDTILDAIDTDFVEVSIHPEEDFFFAAVLVDTEPPFEGQVIPNIGQPLTLLHLEARVRGSAAELDELTIQLENGLSNPPLSNLMVVDNQSIAVDELETVTIDLPGPRREPLFIRGDTSVDSRVEMADALRILEYRFLGRATLPCMDAADVNDDDQVTMSDAVFLLTHLYVGGASPPAPTPRMGRDPTPGTLGCRVPLRFEGS